jgi:hypothetical protein
VPTKSKFVAERSLFEKIEQKLKVRHYNFQKPFRKTEPVIMHFSGSILPTAFESIDEELETLKRRIEHLENVKAKRSRCRTIVEEAICFLETKHMKLEEVLNNFKGIGSNQDFWIAYVKAKERLPLDIKGGTVSLLMTHGLLLLEDKELIVQSLSKIDRSKDDETVFDFLNEDLKSDKDVVRAFLERGPYFCLTKYSSYVKAHPDLIANVLQEIPLSCREVSENLSGVYVDLLRSNRSVVLAWARAGGFANPDFMEEWAEDEEMLLEFLKHDS